MSMRKNVNKYETNDGSTYFGLVGDSWIDLQTGALHLGDGETPGGDTVITAEANGTITVPGALIGAQGVGATGGYTFGGTEASADTGMFSPVDGQVDFYANGVEVMAITAGQIGVIGSIVNQTSNTAVTSTYMYDNSVNPLTVAPSGTVTFARFSGMLIVDDTAGGNVEMWICGASNGVKIANTAVSTNTLTYVGSSTVGYVWTNNSGASGPFTFTAIRTRAHG